MSTVRQQPATKAGHEISIRWMIRADMPAVLAIEGQAFEYPWSEDDFKNTLRRRSCIGMVAEVDDGTRDGVVVGHMVYDLRKHGLQLLRMAVAPAWRRQGVGRRMVDKMVAKLSYGRRRTIEIAVADNNLAAHLFLRACGFKAVSVIRSFEPDDEYLFRYTIGSDLE